MNHNHGANTVTLTCTITALRHLAMKSEISRQVIDILTRYTMLANVEVKLIGIAACHLP